MKHIDWVGNTKSVFVTNGDKGHTAEERQIDDYYATEPIAVEYLLENESFTNTVWECACGEGHISNVLAQNGYTVLNSDIVDRGYPNTSEIDFLGFEGTISYDIITNPPYKYAAEFVERAIEVVEKGNKVAMFLKLTFLEGKKRKALFKKYPPKTIYVSSSRLKCAKNGDFDGSGSTSSAVAYAWFVWEKGFNGEPVIRWIN